MKRFAIFVLSAGAAVAVTTLLVRHFWMSDEEVYRRLAGTWVFQFGQGSPIRSSMTFGADGGYQCRQTGFPDGTILTVEGKWQVKDGAVTDRVTNHFPAAVTVMPVAHGRIVRINEHELVTTWEYTKDGTQVVAQKAALH